MHRKKCSRGTFDLGTTQQYLHASSIDFHLLSGASIRRRYIGKKNKDNITPSRQPLEYRAVYSLSPTQKSQYGGKKNKVAFVTHVGVITALLAASTGAPSRSLFSANTLTLPVTIDIVLVQITLTTFARVRARVLVRYAL